MNVSTSPTTYKNYNNHDFFRSIFDLASKYLKNPFVFDRKNIQILLDLFNTKNSHIGFDIALINDETYLPNGMIGTLYNIEAFSF